MSKNIVWQDYAITPELRENKNGHKPAVLWFTGYSGSGKSTLANATLKILFEKGVQCYGLDGDNIRHGLNRDLDFSDQDRKENIRRVAEVSKLFCDAGMIVTTAFISPFQKDRDQAKAIIGERFFEIYLNTNLEICESRDPKGLYKKARANEIQEFTGIDSPYEPPAKPSLTINTEQSLEVCISLIENFLKDKMIL